MIANPLLGTALHAVGATFAATCYTPQKKVNGWSWQTYWLTQAAFCWLILPILGAWLTIPDLWNILMEAPKDAMWKSYVLGAAYGIGGTAFGISIRYIGFSLTYAIAVGLSSVLGTMLPPLLRGQMGEIAQKTGAFWVFVGIGIGVAGIGLCGLSGRLKEIDLTAQQNKGGFSLIRGLLLSLLAGVLSAVYGLSLEAGQPIADVAVEHGNDVFGGNVVYIFSNTGAFLTTAIYCLYLGIKHKSLGELVELPAGQEEAKLPVNFLMAALTGLFWYGQFFFYNLGHIRMGEYKFTSWAIHMIMLVLISNAVGIILMEWKACRPRTKAAITVALNVLVAAILVLTYGNWLGEQANKAGWTVAKVDGGAVTIVLRDEDGAEKTQIVTTDANTKVQLETDRMETVPGKKKPQIKMAPGALSDIKVGQTVNILTTETNLATSITVLRPKPAKEKDKAPSKAEGKAGAAK